ncbi:hypothetical protein FRC11_005170 [Ceratobasidium sp. 423]|nr:hypothetical protein FRC11_005170 [Ceratobasidium sp. 423]
MHGAVLISRPKPIVDNASTCKTVLSLSYFDPNSIQCYLVDPPQEFDEEGKELGPDAQVWKTYVKEADRVDEELVDGWNNFVIESYKNLKPDPADVSAQTLLVMSQTLWSLANGSQPTNPSPPPGMEAPPFKASPSAICVNVLWFLSLSLSVAVSLISMLAKEWCLEFMSGRTGPFGAQARRRQQRWDGIVEWRMKEVIIMLPSLIHLSLLLFAIGLCVFLWDVHYGVAIPVVLVTFLAAGAYFACTILPSRYNFCPYGTVLSRLYKQFSPVHSPVKGDEEAQDEVPGKALHWMIVNCETPRSVDVALQSLAAGDEKISPVMLERCDAWTLILRRLESVDANGEQSEVVSALYKRALKSHVDMRQGADGLRYNNPYFTPLQQLAQSVLDVQSCINRYDTDEELSSHANLQHYSVIHKLLQRLGPLDQRRSMLERSMLIGPRLLEFECHVGQIGGSGVVARQGRTWWWKRPLEYNETTHQEDSESLAEAIIRLLEQGIRGETDMEPELVCILSASLIVLFCRKMAIKPQSSLVLVGYVQRLIQAYQLRTSSDIGDTRNRLQNSSVSNELHKSMIILLLGALSISNSPCSIEKSPCFFDSPSDEHMNSYRRSEKVLELVWKYLIGIIYSDTSSFNKDRYLIHGGLHLITRAQDYHVTSEDCMFIANLMNYAWYPPSEIDDSCLVHHIQEFFSALTPSPDLDALTPQLQTCLSSLPIISSRHVYLIPTPELYVLILKRCCRHGDWDKYDLGYFMHRFPFPKASPRLIDLLSNSGVFNLLVDLLDSIHSGDRAFAIAHLWLLFNMSIQASNHASPSSTTLKKMLLQYPGLEHNLDNQEEVTEELEYRLATLLDTRDVDFFLKQYLYRILECMLQQRCTPLPEKGCVVLGATPERLRGSMSFVDLEAEASGPSSGNGAPDVVPETGPEASG